MSPKRPKPDELMPYPALCGAPDKPSAYDHSPPTTPPGSGAPKRTVEPRPRTALLRVSDSGAPSTSKKTAVRTSIGIRASNADVLVSVTVSVEPVASKSADAERVPTDAVNLSLIHISEP